MTILNSQTGFVPVPLYTGVLMAPAPAARPAVAPVGNAWQDVFQAARGTRPAAVPIMMPPARPALTPVRPVTFAPAGSDSPANHPVGRGQVLGASSAGTAAGRAALRAAGGISLVGASRFNEGREVAVLASPHFDPARPYQVLVYCHGLGGSTANSVGDREHMGEAVEKLNARGANVLLVMPKGPVDKAMGNWMAGKDDDLGALTDEALANFAGASGLPLGAPAERILMGHSAGGNPIANAYAGSHPPRFDKVMMADSSYGLPPTYKLSSAGKFVNALDGLPGPRPQVAIVVTGGDTERHAREDLAPRGIAIDKLPPVNHNSTNPAIHNDYPGHFGVPSYMLSAFLSGAPGSLPFSSVGPRPAPARRPTRR